MNQPVEVFHHNLGGGHGSGGHGSGGEGEIRALDTYKDILERRAILSTTLGHVLIEEDDLWARHILLLTFSPET